ncbi:MAG: hypothetical protein PHF84_06290 [bacterium]|nr:hypothetical protein [bacterium]
MKKFTVCTFILILFMTGKTAYSEGLSGDIYIAGVSKYLWRGQDLYDKFALQPGFDLSLSSFSLGFWSSYHPDAEALAEADLTLSYSYEPMKNFTGNLGYTFYSFPQPVYGDSHEVYAGISYSGFLSPGLKLFYDFDDGDGLYAELSCSQGFSLGPEFSLGASLGFNAGQWGYESSLTVLGLSLSTVIPAGPVEISPVLFGQLALDDQYKNDDNLLDGYAGLSVKYNF